MTASKQFLLGLVFLSALAILGYYTLFLTEFRLFGEVYPMTVHFPEAGGLRQGDAVLVAGIRDGKVSALTYDPAAPDDRRVTVTLALDQRVELRQDHSIEIASATVLGGNVVRIDPGSYDSAPLPADTPLFGRVAPDALEGLSQLVGDNRERIDRILADVELAAGDFQAVLAGVRNGQGLLGRVMTDPQLAQDGSQAIERVSGTFDNLQQLTDRVLAGEGVIGKLFTDQDLVEATERLAHNLAEVSDELKLITSDVSEGRGMIGHMLTDEKAGVDLSASVASLRGIVEKINAGDGTLGRLVTDDTLARNVTAVSQRLADGEGTIGKLLADPAVADDVAVITHRLAQGEGTMGQLLTNEELYHRINGASQSLEEILRSIREGRGSLGRIVMHDDLYQDVKRALGVVNRSLEEYREVAPISSFSSVIFGAF